MMRLPSSCLHAITAIIFWIGQMITAVAQPTPQSLITSYVTELAASVPNPEKIQAVTTSDYKLVVLDADVGTALTRLRRAGAVVDVAITAIEEFSDFTAYTAMVQHAAGGSQWQFKIQGERIALATLDDIDDAQQGTGAAANAGSGRRYHSARRPAAPSQPNVIHDAIDIAPSSPKPCATIAAICNAASSDQDPRMIDFLFVTDRKPTAEGGNIPSFGSDRNVTAEGTPLLTYGGASVRIPEDHRIGRIELPATWQLFGWQLKWQKEDEKKDLIVKRLAMVSAADWGKLIKDQGSKTALVFVHGFNTSFNAAILRNAQIAWDLQFKGTSVLYSWSSKGQVTDYLYDKDSALFARAGFLEVIRRLRDELGMETINVIAHSMGNLVAVDALRESAGSLKPVSVNQLVMASPDVDRSNYIAALPNLAKVTKGMTLYASAADKALEISGKLADFPRAGGIGPLGPVLFPSLETIDVTAIGDELLGLNHTEFATNRAVMDDLKILLDEHRPAPRLSEIRAFPEPPKPGNYWKYVP